MVELNFTIKQMSIIREFIDQNPQETKRLLGMEYPQLIDLIKSAELLDEKRRRERDKTKIRLIKSGSGCPSKLSVEDRLLLTLMG
ncbi:MAG TPA: hypothetical protein DEG17_04690 [Cyanobacteria bacterium UBA11149]|nr:hypothetical protein [Cyanobacteria bacterium UBA11367]HBE58181.1 hypothetical protein [Cyanobacteria bacterium UBA11366]HBK64923.1 hypothetical protein [Cyanobacteria bacterium UBA11166]HBR72657.1 hypothetical protein [Cyanobacteria bacterium UBA11159]HBS70193.1 hypothetical protein [Cyanobacteria bacterium UBA11153]HBW88187.1 hypothetical protein [Cyanobacteria bacterium UBA11149]HCA95690.1 hypothetical protein [Cyanobacteria bacterium UBA9226]